MKEHSTLLVCAVEQARYSACGMVTAVLRHYQQGEVQCMWNGDCSAKALQARRGARGIVEQALNGSPTYFNSKEFSH